ncbi:hypothetical protein EJ08DRAFT_414548 [Tothia fuscella]|uniref:PWI domain-containing protein n=1 Tax=Tothia fuscella TaxID=1048955 RepID=A0A9P4NK25_9PEZI|nr:hypothetical protein EJ08DRAFT_414548 [Tothia fuscella]
MAFNGPPGAAYGAPGQWPPGGGPPGGPGALGSSSPAPGAGFPPGMPGGAHGLPPRPGNLPPGWAPPTNMPNINFNAPVIRLGTTGPAGSAPFGARPQQNNADPAGNRRGLGMDRSIDQQRQQVRESMMSFQPPTREELLRTIFVGNIPDGVGGDANVERILRTAGGLRRWTRAIDADNKPCKFGFAEYEDAQSLETAAEMLTDVQVPLKKPVPKAAAKIENGEGATEEDEEEVEKATLLVVVDEASKAYAEEWRERRGESTDELQFRVDAAKETLEQVLTSLFKPFEVDTSQDGDFLMPDAAPMADPETGEVIMIPINGEDELSEIPQEFRETVAKEIADFRDRSIRRDKERLRREEEMEARERANAGFAGSNNIPLGPRDRGVQGAPSGPKGRGGIHGAQIPKDYQNGVTFINGNSAALSNYISKEDEDSDASDSELEERRREKKAAIEEKSFLDYERRWLNRERSRAAAIQREKDRDANEEATTAREKEIIGKRLKEWDDNYQENRRVEEYYVDRGLWLRNREAFRRQERQFDDQDREEERREQDSINQARGLADNFLDRQAEELSARGIATQEPAQQRFKISLGAAAQKAQAAALPKRRTVADVEGLLDNEEEEEDHSIKRTLIPIKFDPAANAALTDDEKRDAQKSLAQEIPNDKDELFKWNIAWEFLDETTVKETLRQFVEKKVMEYLGVQEDIIVDVVEERIKAKSGPKELILELEGALDEEAEVLVKKLWRMIIFYTESEKRGYST